MQVETIVTALEAGLGVTLNLFLILTMYRTWSQWRQVKWYVVMLIVGNMLEVIFSLGIYIAWRLIVTWDGSTASCKFLMFLRCLGPSLANMAVAALGLHVLLASITGDQGNRLRHMLVVGLFVLLSLFLPVSQIPIYEVLIKPGTTHFKQCVNFAFFASPKLQKTYDISAIVALTFFPLAVMFFTWTLALTLNLTSNREPEKRKLSSPDIVLTGLLGLMMALCCVPYDGISLYGHIYPSTLHMRIFTVHRYLVLLTFARPIVSAFVCAVFGCVQASRTTPEITYHPPYEESSGTGEETINSY